MPIGVTRVGAHQFADLCFGETEGAGCCACDIRPCSAAVGRALPLVSNCSETISIGQSICCSEHLVLRGSSAYAHRTRRCVIHIDDCCRGTAVHALECSMPVGVTRVGAHQLAD